MRAFGALPSWQGVWYIDDGIFDRIGPGPNRPEGPGPDIFDRKLSQHPPYNVDWEARYQGLRVALAHAFSIAAKGCTFYFPAIMEGPYAFEVLITAEETAFIFERGSAVRHVLTDGRRHPSAQDRWPSPWGDSVGHWEGGTLVVDTIAVAKDPTPFFAMVSPDARFTERIRQIDADHLQDQLTVTDTVAFVHPWTVILTYKRVRILDRLIHGDCMENDRDAIIGGKFEIKLP